MIKIKRIYEIPSEDDGYRILVDRLWPRGVSKEFATLDEWNKTITPSPELRIWFNHQAERFETFSALYKEELTNFSEELHRLKTLSETQNLTLLYAAKDPKINHAIVLLDVLNKI
ncbi:MAG: hypothetical protein BGO29_10325 [Bacteroidales bacterium 36-12]|jgi:uncharacterized protein YeaO (DUF488 family)|nr:MAG: hypothetical protein BGO29_10325 [Bacteroidales bacterium 36-12]